MKLDCLELLAVMHAGFYTQLIKPQKNPPSRSHFLAILGVLIMKPELCTLYRVIYAQVKQ